MKIEINIEIETEAKNEDELLDFIANLEADIDKNFENITGLRIENLDISEVKCNKSIAVNFTPKQKNNFEKIFNKHSNEPIIIK